MSNSSQQPKYKITFRTSTQYAETLAEAKKKRTKMRGGYDETCTIWKWDRYQGMNGGYEPHA